MESILRHPRSNCRIQEDTLNGKEANEFQQWWLLPPEGSESQCVVLSTQTVLHGVEKANLESRESS